MDLKPTYEWDSPEFTRIDARQAALALLSVHGEHGAVLKASDVVDAVTAGRFPALAAAFPSDASEAARRGGPEMIAGRMIFAVLVKMVTPGGNELLRAHAFVAVFDPLSPNTLAWTHWAPDPVPLQAAIALDDWMMRVTLRPHPVAQ